MSDSVPEGEVPRAATATEPGAPTAPPPEPAHTPAGPAVAPATPAHEPATPAHEPATPAHDPSAPAYDPAAPAPLNVPRAPSGNADVDAQLARLADADHLATDGHVEVYEDVHRGLRDALTALDARPGPPAPPSTYPRS
ncbi:hypothetical protein AB0912_29655 [Streptomyces sp. NPDC007084]|uniref:hypothetical protein n=1 Tax=Streptomyces sp. NPDC007084 TaxID=3154313 RepID=UPI0034570D00